MNSIRRPRSRPRVDSLSFRVFGWVVLREAALRVIYPSAVGSISEPAARRTLAASDTSEVRDVTRVALAVHPERVRFGGRAVEVVATV
jgi:hypothetical protein